MLYPACFSTCGGQGAWHVCGCLGRSHVNSRKCRSWHTRWSTRYWSLPKNKVGNALGENNQSQTGTSAMVCPRNKNSWGTQLKRPTCPCLPVSPDDKYCKKLSLQCPPAAVRRVANLEGLGDILCCEKLYAANAELSLDETIFGALSLWSRKAGTHARTIHYQELSEGVLRIGSLLHSPGQHAHMGETLCASVSAYPLRCPWNLWKLESLSATLNLHKVQCKARTTFELLWSFQELACSLLSAGFVRGSLFHVASVSEAADISCRHVVPCRSGLPERLCRILPGCKRNILVHSLQSLPIGLVTHVAFWLKGCSGRAHFCLFRGRDHHLWTCCGCDPADLPLVAAV